jgi:branched-subunit amino acid aminotransferase/4-amino-4-deoxychorismate lyase
MAGMLIKSQNIFGSSMMYFFNFTPTNDSQLIHTYFTKWLDLEGCFETLLVENGKIQFLSLHIDRALKANEQYFHLKYDYGKLLEVLPQQISKYCNVQKKYKLKIIFSKNNIFYSLAEYQSNLPIVLNLVSQKDSEVCSGFKLCSYQNQVNLLNYAKTKNAFDCVRTDERLFLETSRANIFFCKGDEIFTPKANNLLPGIIRQVLLAKNKVQESNILIKSLGEFDGMLITNSLIGIVAVDSLDNHRFSSSKHYIFNLQKAIFS